MNPLGSAESVARFIHRHMNKNLEFQRPYQIPPIAPPHPPLSDVPDKHSSKLEYIDLPIPTYWEIDLNKYKYFIPTSNSKTYLSPHDIRTLIANPRLAASNLRMEQKGGSYDTPAHLPNIEDLKELDPIAVGRWIEWQSEVDEGETTVIDKFCCLFDPAPILPQKRIVHELRSSGIDLEIRVISNAFYVSQTIKEYMQIEFKAKRWWNGEKKMTMIQITIKPMEDALYSWKTCKFVIEETSDEEEWSTLLSIPLMPDPRTFLAWNARGIARPSFCTNLNHLCGFHLPNFVVILETKTSIAQTPELIQDLRFDKSHALESEGLLGGMVILWDSRWVDFSVINGDGGAIHGIIQAGTKAYSPGSDPYEIMEGEPIPGEWLDSQLSD